MEEVEALEDINQTILAVDFIFKDSQKIVGAGFINNDKKVLQIVEFEDNDYLSYLESLIIQLNNEANKETKFQVLINMPNDESYNSRITDILSQCEVEFTVGNKKDFTTKDAELMLSSLLSNSIQYYDEEISKDLSLGALRSAINFTDIHSNRANHGKYTLSTYSMNDYLRLDVAAMNALNLFPQNLSYANQLGSNEMTSIYQLFNKTKTSIGSRLIRKWLKQPVRDESEINRRLDIVEFFVNDENIRNNIQNDHLRQFPDIEKLHAKFYKVKNNLPHRANLVD